VAGHRRRRGINDLKGRIAEALVEGIFQRAGYAVSRTGRESQVQGLLRNGRVEFLPDFLIRRSVTSSGSDRPLHCLVSIEVKFRRDLKTYLEREGRKDLGRAASWPDLYLILVTDRPEPERSCFQVLDPRRSDGATADLHAVHDLDIYESTVREYEGLVHKIFPLLDDTIPDGRSDVLTALN
jgi:hypothetical protein